MMEEVSQPGYPVPRTRVLLWSAPRCLSTVFERSIRELKDVKVIHEPHKRAFYYGPEKSYQWNLATYTEKMDQTATFKAADEKLLAEYKGFSAVFAKNHAFFVRGRCQEYIHGPFSNFKHTFLIRHPSKAFPSQYKACAACKFNFDDTNTSMYCQLYEMFRAVQEVESSPLVLDADDLLENPKGMMELYCSATGLPFDDDMLSWSPGVVPDSWMDTIQPEVWYGTAIRSSGFLKPKPPAVVSLSEFPEVVRKAVDDALPSYEAMHSARITCN